jgi:hypothetical protein
MLQKGVKSQDCWTTYCLWRSGGVEIRKWNTGKTKEDEEYEEDEERGALRASAFAADVDVEAFDFLVEG